MYNILIRPIRIKDAEISFKWRNDPEIWQFTANRPDKLITLEIERNWLTEKLIETNVALFAIIVNDQYIGNIQITDIIEREKGEYQIFIGEKTFWGNGISRQATAQIIRLAREKLNLKELYLIVNPNHLAAIHLYEKCGFIRISNEIRMKLNPDDSIPPVISVFLMTYNHEKFIEQALKGILMQKTNFDFDIVVGEDCSTDNTRKILLEYADKYPGKFKLLLHERNIGAMANQIAVFSACKGRYIALCEGDDCWIDPSKLQKQVDFLENNTDCGLVHTDYNILMADEKGLNEIKSYHNTTNKLIPVGKVHKALIRNNFIASLTVVARRSLIDDYFAKMPMKRIFSYIQGDYPLWLYIAGQTNIGYINSTTSSYRVLESSISHSKQKMKKIAFLLSEYRIKIDFILKYRILDLPLYGYIIKRFLLRLWVQVH